MFVVFYTVNLHICVFMTCSTSRCLYDTHIQEMYICIFYTCKVLGRKSLNFIFCWPCTSIHLCNKNQLHALFIFNLFCQSTSTCFRHIFSPSSGGILYTYNSWCVLCFLVDTVCQRSTEKHNTYQLLYIYIILPDDGLQICPKHVKVNSASS